MGKNGLIALAGLAVLFFVLSELVGNENDPGFLSRIAGSSASETAPDDVNENGEAGDASPESREMLDEVPPEPDDDFGDPVDDEDFIADDEPIDPAEGFAPTPDITPPEFPSGPGNGSPGGRAANPRSANPALETARSNDALARDLAKAGVIDESRKRR
jgi:hypothetical protein